MQHPLASQHGHNNNDTLADQDFDINCLALSLSDDSNEYYFNWRQLRIEETYPLENMSKILCNWSAITRVDWPTVYMNKCHNRKTKATEEYIHAEMEELVLVGKQVGDLQAMRNKCTSVWNITETYNLG